MYLKYDSSRELAIEIKDLINKEKHGGYTVRPYNRFESESSEWWVLKTTGMDTPAFPLGKVSALEEHGVFCVGLYVERGYGQTLTTFVPDEQVLNGTWKWNHFILDLENGQFEEAISTIPGEILGLCSLEVQLIRWNERVPATSCKFAFYTCSHIKCKTEHDHQDLLFDLSRVSQLRQVGHHLSALSNTDDYWINVYIAASFDKWRRGSEGTVISTNNLWEMLALEEVSFD